MPTMSERVRDRFGAAVPKIHTVDGETRAVFVAAQAAFKRLDYNLLRTNIGALRVEAASRINSSVAFRDSRQLVAMVEIRSVSPTQSEVTMHLKELVEGEGPGGASEQSLREHGFFDTYFAVLQQVLAEQSAERAGKKN